MKLPIHIGLTILALMVCGAVMAQDKMKAPAWRGPVMPSAQEAASNRLAPVPLPPPPPPPLTGPFFNNLTPYVGSNGVVCSTCLYDTNSGNFVLGPNNCFGTATSENLAYSFVAGRNGAVAAIIVAVTLDSNLCIGTSNQFRITLYNDVCAGPNAILATGVVTAPTAPCGVATLSFAPGTGPLLTQGRTYWVACETPSCTSDFLGVWWEARSAIAYSNALCPSGSYAASYFGSPGAFEVL